MFFGCKIHFTLKLPKESLYFYLSILSGVSRVVYGCVAYFFKRTSSIAFLKSALLMAPLAI